MTQRIKQLAFDNIRITTKALEVIKTIVQEYDEGGLADIKTEYIISEVKEVRRILEKVIEKMCR